MADVAAPSQNASERLGLGGGELHVFSPAELVPGDPILPRDQADQAAAIHENRGIFASRSDAAPADPGLRPPQAFHKAETIRSHPVVSNRPTTPGHPAARHRNGVAQLWPAPTR